MSRTRLAVVAGALVPWIWFAVDDLGVAAEQVGLALPAIGVLSALLGVGVAIPRRTRWAAVPLVSLTLVTLVAVVVPLTPHDTDPPRSPVVVAAANVMGRADDRILDEITAQDADIVMVSEVSQPVDGALARQYPYRVVTDEVGVYSRLPFSRPRPLPFLYPTRGRAVTVDGPDGKFLFLGVHLPRPAPRAHSTYQVTYAEHQEIVSDLADWIEGQDLPVVVAGDLNVSDRGPSYHRLTEVTDDAMRSGWAAPTSLRWPQRLLLLRLDHVLVPEGWCWAGSARFDLHGSDHRGVRTAVGSCR